MNYFVQGKQEDKDRKVKSGNNGQEEGSERGKSKKQVKVNVIFLMSSHAFLSKDAKDLDSLSREGGTTSRQGDSASRQGGGASAHQGDILVQPAPYDFADPCPQSMRHVRISDLSSVDINWKMLTLARPTTKIDADIFSK